ncbi:MULTISPECIES: DUF4286 family protein [Streptacidiphilus]|uniref:DUF4286 family protein n=1 Tax=Streptacidiphilus cavernicola TaxID=3342716 RepID=A0ABV6UUY7_9ACTN|nr:DUF4286 family protein [Streptacidiphilus jeojiense]
MTDSSQPAHEILLALTNPVEGREEEFRTWYWETHIPEVLALPGIVSARRYLAPESAAGVSHRYVTLYEVEGSAEAARDKLFTSGLSTSDALDVTTVAMLPLLAKD